MLQGIEFTNKRFDREEENNKFIGLTKNTVVICNNYSLMDSLAEEIINTVNGKAEYNNYFCDDGDIGKAKYDLSFGLQRIININGQKITLGLEPALIYKAKEPEDIWFYDYIGKEKIYNEQLYPLTIFKRYDKEWEEGLDNIYKMVVNGRYGGYDGKWVKELC